MTRFFLHTNLLSLESLLLLLRLSLLLLLLRLRLLLRSRDLLRLLPRPLQLNYFISSSEHGSRKNVRKNRSSVSPPEATPIWPRSASVNGDPQVAAVVGSPVQLIHGILTSTAQTAIGLLGFPTQALSWTEPQWPDQQTSAQ